MKKRQLILNDYRTAEDGLFTLSACKITKAAQEQTFVKVPGRFAPLDLSTVLTDGQPYYGNAKLDAVLESSEGTRAERQERIERLKNLLDGQIAKIVHPDFPGRYMVGRVEVIPDFNGLAYCSVALSAVLEPWLYNDEETEAVSVLPYYEPEKNLFDVSQGLGNYNGLDGEVRIENDAFIITVLGRDPFWFMSDDHLKLPNGSYYFYGEAEPNCTVDLWTSSGSGIITNRGAFNIDDSSRLHFELEGATNGQTYKVKIAIYKEEKNSYVPFVNAGGTNLFRAELGGDGYLESGYYDGLEVIDANTITGIPKAGQGSDFIRFAQKYPPGVYTLRNKGRDPRQMFWLFDADGNNISAQHQASFGVPYNSYYDGFYSPGEELIVTIPNGVAYWRFGVFFQPYGGNKVTLSEIQVSRGEGTPYEPTYPLGDERIALTNGGKLAVAPVVEVEGSVTLTIGNTSRAMSTGSYLLPELYLTPGEHHVQCSGAGTAKITYREAVLAG